MKKLQPLKKTLLATLLGSSTFFAHAQEATQQSDTTQSGSSSSSSDTLDKVVVTARKRTETLVEVPMNITAVSAAELKERNLSSVRDIYRTIAGGSSAVDQLILRGLSGGNSASPNTTSQFVDGIPFDAANIFDVERVEVLRGPQGTLWGSNAIGGTVQIVTNKPQMDALEVFSTWHAGSEKDVDGIARRIEAGINIPLVADTLAARVVASNAWTPGQIYNAATDRQASRKSDFLRAQLQWVPSEDIALNLGYIVSRGHDIGSRRADRSKPGFYRVANFTPNQNSAWGFDVAYDRVECAADAERPACFGSTNGKYPTRYTIHEIMDNWSKNRTDVISLGLNHDNLFGFASLSYIGSYRESRDSSLDDWSRLDMDDLTKTWIINENASKRVTHEIRLQNNEPLAGFNWTMGLFQDRYWESYNPNQQWQFHLNTPQDIAVFSDWNDWAWGAEWEALGIRNVGELGQVLYGDPSKNYNFINLHTKSNESAAFGELSYEFNTSAGKFEVTAGLRYFRLDDATGYARNGIWIGPEPNTSWLGGKESGNRKKFSISWMPSDSMNLYALYSEGYRPGGNNGPMANACLNDEYAGQHRERYTSDTIDNYELGFKGAFFNRRLRLASALYHIDWTDVRTSIYMPSCGFSYVANAANARSRGVELESSLYLGESTLLTFNASYTDSVMLDDVPALGAKRGDNMTMVPKYNAYLAVDHELKAFSRPVFLRADIAAYGKYKTHFNMRDEDRSPAYQTLNLSGRVELNEQTTLSLHINNVLNKQYTTFKSARSRSSNRQALHEIYGTGRSFGLRLDYKFN